MRAGAPNLHTVLKESPPVITPLSKTNLSPIRWRAFPALDPPTGMPLDPLLTFYLTLPYAIERHLQASTEFGCYLQVNVFALRGG